MKFLKKLFSLMSIDLTQLKTLFEDTNGKILLAVSAMLAGVIIAGLFTLYEKEPLPGQKEESIGYYNASVLKSGKTDCPGDPSQKCSKVFFKLSQGEDKNKISEILWDVNVSGKVPPTGKRATLVKYHNDEFSPQTVLTGEYTFSHFKRDFPMLVLAIILFVLVILISRLHGLRSLLGLCASLALIIYWLLPTLLSSSHSILVALCGAGAVLLFTLVCTHGITLQSISSFICTFLTLAFILLIVSVWVDWASLTGVAEESQRFLSINRPNISIQGIVFAAAIIGALGVLDDVTVSQSSVVLSLARVRKWNNFRELFLEAMRVGKDHIAATMNTLVLAYVGSSLSLLLILSDNSQPWSVLLENEQIASSIIITLAGAIGLVMAVPITTALVSYFSLKLSSEIIETAKETEHIH